MFKIENEKDIKDRIFNLLKNDLNKAEGSIINDIVSTLALEIINNQIIFKNGFENSFIETAKGDILDMRCKEHGITRKPGTRAIGKIIIEADEEIEIKKDTELINPKTKLIYRTVNTVTTNTDCIIIADTIGVKYNADQTNILALKKPNKKIKSIRIIENIENGSNKESDEELKERLYFVVANPEGVGTIADYERWAREIDGVKIAKALPCFYGNGTVKILIGGENNTIIDDEIIKKVQNYICPLGEYYGKGKAPIGSTVTVETFKKIPITIKITELITEDNFDLELVKSKLEDNIKNYLYEKTNLIIYNEIIGVIINSYGVLDFSNVKINNAKNNIMLEYDEKGILEGVLYDQKRRAKQNKIKI